MPPDSRAPAPVCAPGRGAVFFRVALPITLSLGAVGMAGCGEGGGVGFGGGSGEDGGDGPAADCPDDWEIVQGATLAPASCLAWSDRSDEQMSWSAAVTAAEAEAGGCTTTCDTDAAAWCDPLDPLSGWGSWRTPGVDELDAFARSTPPIEPLDGALWTRTSDTLDELAWTVALDAPGASAAIGKTSMAYVRCVADPS